MPEHRDGRTTDTRQLILKEAEKLYYAGGYDNINLQVIADHLKITKAALFHHFKNKQALFFELLLAIVASMRRMFEAMIDEGDQSTHARLSRIMLRWAEEPTFDLMRFQREEIVFLDPDQQREVGQAWHAGMFQVLERVFHEGILRGDLQDHDTTMATYLFLNVCVLLPHVDNPMHAIMGYENQEQYIAKLLNILMNGLGKTVSNLP
jgi:AcrR family transcriptional regulator